MGLGSLEHVLERLPGQGAAAGPIGDKGRSKSKGRGQH
jgi:hypothetical protein